MSEPTISRTQMLGGLLHLKQNQGFEPKTVIDVGAALGTFELYNAFPLARHFMIEPIVENEPHLATLCSKLPNAEYIIAAAASQSGIAELHVNPELVHSSVAEVHQSQREQTHSETGDDPYLRKIPAVTLDEICQQYNLLPPYLIKLDVDGNEPDVLAGATQILNDTEYLIIEVSLFGQIHKVIDFMRSQGFVIYDILDLSHRSSDNALWQADMAFVKEKGQFRQDKNYIAEDRQADLNTHLRAWRSQYMQVIDRLQPDDFVPGSTPASTPVPMAEVESVRVDLGCGIWKPEGFIGVDVASHPNVDIVADLTRRFPFADSSVDLIRAYDVIEHLPDRIHTMNEIWRIARPGALVDIRVPSTDGRGAFQDPTHVSYWNVNSFQYYCAEFPAYHQLCQSYGFKGAFRLLTLTQETSEDQVVHVHAQLQVLKPTEAEEYSENLDSALKLKQINLLACPDWEQPEDDLLETLVQMLQIALTHPQKDTMTLLIDASSTSLETADLALSGAMMQLVSDTDLEFVESSPEIVLLELMEPATWQALQSRLSGRIELD